MTTVDPRGESYVCGRLIGGSPENTGMKGSGEKGSREKGREEGRRLLGAPSRESGRHCDCTLPVADYVVEAGGSY